MSNEQTEMTQEEAEAIAAGVVAHTFNKREVTLLQNGECSLRTCLYQHRNFIPEQIFKTLDIAAASIQAAMNESGLVRIAEPIVDKENEVDEGPDNEYQPGDAVTIDVHGRKYEGTIEKVYEKQKMLVIKTPKEVPGTEGADLFNRGYGEIVEWKPDGPVEDTPAS